MIYITAKSLNDAWCASVHELMSRDPVENLKYYWDEPMVIDILNPVVTAKDHRFPMSQKDLDTINHYLVSGEDEENVCHEWTKVYRHRLFDEPNSQIEYILRNLDQNRPYSSCHASIWNKEVDQEARIQPCAQVVWARIKRGKLDLHVHAHSCDAYNKLLMNLQEFVSLHHYLAKRSAFPVGRYLHFIDSCHIKLPDVEKVREVFA